MKAVQVIQVLMYIATTCASLTKVGVVHQLVTLKCGTKCDGTKAKWTRGHELELVFKREEDGTCNHGSAFKNRVQMSETCDLIIDQLKYNDEGVYTLTCDGGGQPVDRKLYVVAPVEVNVTAGDNVALRCYAGTTAGAKPYNLWRKDDKEQVLRFENGKFSYGKKMEGRVSASEEGYRSGDYFLNINNTLPSDSGLYICDYSETGDQEKFRGASRAFQLNVQAKKKAFQIGVGGRLDLPITDSAEVTFKADGSAPPQDVCHIKGSQLQRSSPKYAGRVTVMDNVLTLAGFSSGDAGEYTVKTDGEVIGAFSVTGHQGETWPTSAIVVVTILCVFLVVIFVVLLYVGWGWLPKRCGTAEERRSDPSASQYEAAPGEDSQDKQLSTEALPHDPVPEVNANQPSLSSMETGSHSTEPLGRQREEESVTVEDETSV